MIQSTEIVKVIPIKEYEAAEREQVGKTAFRMGLGKNGLPDDEEPEGLKYPQLVFPVEAMPQGGILHKLVDKACEGGLSAGLVVPAILTLVSAVPRADKMAGAGKDTAIDRALEVTG